MSDEFDVDPAELETEQARLKAVAGSMSETVADINTAAGEVSSETGQWREEWEALDAYDPTAADLSEGLRSVAASLGAIASELNEQAMVSTRRASETEDQEATNSATIDGIDTDLGSGGADGSTPSPAGGAEPGGTFEV